jgi:hypothetical protein
LRELAIGLHVVTDLKRCEANVKCADELVVFGRGFRWEIARRTASGDEQEQDEQQYNLTEELLPQRRKGAKWF